MQVFMYMYESTFIGEQVLPMNYRTLFRLHSSVSTSLFNKKVRLFYLYCLPGNQKRMFSRLPSTQASSLDLIPWSIHCTSAESCSQGVIAKL